MSSVITALSTGITLSGLWSTISLIIPFIVIIFTISFGIYLLQKYTSPEALDKLDAQVE